MVFQAVHEQPARLPALWCVSRLKHTTRHVRGRVGIDDAPWIVDQEQAQDWADKYLSQINEALTGQKLMRNAKALDTNAMKDRLPCAALLLRHRCGAGCAKEDALLRKSGCAYMHHLDRACLV